MGRVVLAGSTVCVREIFALVAQRVHAPLLVDVQPTWVVDRQWWLGGHERVGFVQQLITRLVYRPKRREVNEWLWHQWFVEHGPVNAIHAPAENPNKYNRPYRLRVLSVEKVVILQPAHREHEIGRCRVCFDDVFVDVSGSYLNLIVNTSLPASDAPIEFLKVLMSCDVRQSCSNNIFVLKMMLIITDFKVSL